MTTSTASTQWNNIFDGWRSISTALVLALVGYSVMVSVPVLSTAWVGMLGFTEEQVGRVAGADLGGFSIGAIVASFFVARMQRRVLVFIGLAISMAANGLCIPLVEYEQVLWLRLAAGFGSGMFTSIAIVTLGGTTKPVKAFNYLLFAFAFSTALELHTLPQLSIEGIYLFFIALNIMCVAMIPWLPNRGLNTEELAIQQSEENDVEDWRVPRILPILCLVAVGFTYVNIGGYYTYIELAAHADGVAEDWIGPVLTWSSIFAIVGCFLALICSRFGLFKPLFISLLAMFAIVAMLSVGITDMNVMVSLFGFMTLWTFVDVYQSAMMAHMDRKGSLIALMPSVQGFGQFVGPNISASILGAGFGYSTMFVVSGSMAIIAMGLYVGIFLYMHRRKSLVPVPN
ncbi:MFS transporter [Thalassotalea psychrophila]|uniref:MFS transporter n=1 Tax=Thalassotalea psychrophila TaxID=3065647 RepID=A0ABY9TT99_9GAMM|nr:MFS transporter [Colwelliaceae bacterium SQ149]